MLWSKHRLEELCIVVLELKGKKSSEEGSGMRKIFTGSR